MEVAVDRVTQPSDVSEIAETAECPHHWIIESPDGPTSHAECRRCGVIRDFQDFDERMVWPS